MPSIEQWLDQGSTDTCVAAALSVSQNFLERRRTAVRTEAAQLGFHSLGSSSSGIAISDTAFTELIHYCKSHPIPRLGYLPCHTPRLYRTLYSTIEEVSCSGRAILL
jgi:hypothetical protein